MFLEMSMSVVSLKLNVLLYFILKYFTYIESILNLRFIIKYIKYM